MVEQTSKYLEAFLFDYVLGLLLISTGQVGQGPSSLHSMVGRNRIIDQLKQVLAFVVECSLSSLPQSRLSVYPPHSKTSGPKATWLNPKLEIPTLAAFLQASVNLRALFRQFLVYEIQTLTIPSFEKDPTLSATL
jgi:hypothetical protein